MPDFITLSFADMPDVCFASPLAKQIHGYVKCHPEHIDDLHRFRIEIPQTITNATTIHNVSLQLESIPLMAIHFSGSNQHIYVGANSGTGFLYITFKGSGTITLGQNVKTVGTSFFIGEGAVINIGDDCLLSTTQIAAIPPRHSLFNQHDLSAIQTGKPNGIFLEPHVWTAANAMIKNGVRISAGSVVGTRALVVDDIPPQSLVVGIPAKIIKHNVSWTFTETGEGREEVKAFLTSV